MAPPESRIKIPNPDPGMAAGFFSLFWPRKSPASIPGFYIRDSDPGFRRGQVCGNRLYHCLSGRTARLLSIVSSDFFTLRPVALASLAKLSHDAAGSDWGRWGPEAPTPPAPRGPAIGRCRNSEFFLFRLSRSSFGLPGVPT